MESKKQCNLCKETKPLGDFGVSKVGKLGRRGQCRPCYNGENKKYNRTRLYGITNEEYLSLIVVQNGRCGICGLLPSPGQSLCVDHDHAVETETAKLKVRGLLCKRCNRGLGKLGDTIESIRKALAYVTAAPSRGST